MESYSDYLGDLSSKYRVRANKARKILAKKSFGRNLTSPRSALHCLQLHALYQEVADDSGFNVITLDEHYFAGMKESLGEDFIL
ncbi:MAG: hypothetical protein IPJ06_04690 [Saprospiraceae bacterium]|nr:hypothetical protein [Saprospiraceae bacterium]